MKKLYQGITKKGLLKPGMTLIFPADRMGIGEMIISNVNEDSASYYYFYAGKKKMGGFSWTSRRDTESYIVCKRRRVG